MFGGKLLLLAASGFYLFVECSNAIVSRSDLKYAANQGRHFREDSQTAQTILKDYNFDDGYDHKGFGNYLPEAHEGYEGDLYHGHHHEDHHLLHHHLHHHHKHHDASAYHKALAIKSLLIPLTGVALLGAAAAFVTNPILLQLGVISASPLGRRKRDTRPNLKYPGTFVTSEDENRLNDIKLLEKFIAQVPRSQIEAQEKQLMANYFSCSGVTTNKFCLERLACELYSKEGISMPMEANVLSIIVNEIFSNDFIPEMTKNQILKAIERGKMNLQCDVYKCDAMRDTY